MPPTRFDLHRNDATFLIVVALLGLVAWFAYVAVQPRDYARESGSSDYLDTFFGWPAPGIDPEDNIERKREGIAFVGWGLIGLIAGRRRPELWHYISALTVLPTLLIYFSTAPHDFEGYWRLDVAFIPIAAAVVALIARGAHNMDFFFQNKLVLACVVGALLAGALLASGGEYHLAVFLVGVAPPALTGVLLLVRRLLSKQAQKFGLR